MELGGFCLCLCFLLTMGVGASSQLARSTRANERAKSSLPSTSPLSNPAWREYCGESTGEQVEQGQRADGRRERDAAQATAGRIVTLSAPTVDGTTSSVELVMTTGDTNPCSFTVERAQTAPVYSPGSADGGSNAEMARSVKTPRGGLLALVDVGSWPSAAAVAPYCVEFYMANFKRPLAHVCSREEAAHQLVFSTASIRIALKPNVDASFNVSGSAFLVHDERLTSEKQLHKEFSPTAVQIVVRVSHYENAVDGDETCPQPETEFPCKSDKDGTTCLWKGLQCDGLSQCENATDEEACFPDTSSMSETETPQELYSETETATTEAILGAKTDSAVGKEYAYYDEIHETQTAVATESSLNLKSEKPLQETVQSGKGNLTNYEEMEYGPEGDDTVEYEYEDELDTTPTPLTHKSTSLTIAATEAISTPSTRPYSEADTTVRGSSSRSMSTGSTTVPLIPTTLVNNTAKEALSGSVYSAPSTSSPTSSSFLVKSTVPLTEIAITLSDKSPNGPREILNLTTTLSPTTPTLTSTLATSQSWSVSEIAANIEARSTSASAVSPSRHSLVDYIDAVEPIIQLYDELGLKYDNKTDSVQKTTGVSTSTAEHVTRVTDLTTSTQHPAEATKVDLINSTAETIVDYTTSSHSLATSIDETPTHEGPATSESATETESLMTTLPFASHKRSSSAINVSLEEIISNYRYEQQDGSSPTMATTTTQRNIVSISALQFDASSAPTSESSRLAPDLVEVKPPPTLPRPASSSSTEATIASAEISTSWIESDYESTSFSSSRTKEDDTFAYNATEENVSSDSSPSQVTPLSPITYNEKTTNETETAIESESENESETITEIRPRKQSTTKRVESQANESPTSISTLSSAEATRKVPSESNGFNSSVESNGKAITAHDTLANDIPNGKKEQSENDMESSDDSTTAATSTTAAYVKETLASRREESTTATWTHVAVSIRATPSSPQLESTTTESTGQPTSTARVEGNMTSTASVRQESTTSDEPKWKTTGNASLIEEGDFIYRDHYSLHVDNETAHSSSGEKGDPLAPEVTTRLATSAKISTLPTSNVQNSTKSIRIAQKVGITSHLSTFSDGESTPTTSLPTLIVTADYRDSDYDYNVDASSKKAEVLTQRPMTTIAVETRRTPILPSTRSNMSPSTHRQIFYSIPPTTETVSATTKAKLETTTMSMTENSFILEYETSRPDFIDSNDGIISEEDNQLEDIHSSSKAVTFSEVTYTRPEVTTEQTVPKEPSDSKPEREWDWNSVNAPIAMARLFGSHNLLVGLLLMAASVFVLSCVGFLVGVRLGKLKSFGSHSTKKSPIPRVAGCVYECALCMEHANGALGSSLSTGRRMGTLPSGLGSHDLSPFY